MAALSINDFKIIPGIVLYAFGGVGKTTLCRMAAEALGWERTLWLMTDRPISSFDYPEYTDKEPYGVVDLLDEPIEQVVKTLATAKNLAAQGKWRYDLVVLDSISALERYNMDVIDRKSGLRDGRKKWGTQTAELQELIWNLRSGQREPKPRYMGAVVLVTAWVADKEDPVKPKDDKGDPNNIIRPSIRGSFGMDIDHHYNQVLYVAREGVNRSVLLKPEGKVHIKNDFEDRVVVPKLSVPDPRRGNGFVELVKAHGMLKEGAKNVRG
jgi:hypothetical protein